MEQWSNQQRLTARGHLTGSNLSLSAQNDVRSPDDERGATLVEFGLIASMIVMLLLGTVTLGMSFHRSLTLNGSAHEAVRFAATLPVEDNINGWLNAVADVAIESAAGELDESVPGQHICIAYVYPLGGETHDRTASIVETEGSRAITLGATCFEDSRPASERRVQVQIGRDTDVTTGVYTKEISLNATQIARFERTG